MYEVLDRNGVPAGVVEDLPRSARQAGLEVTAMSGFFGVIDPELMLELWAASIAALRERGIQLGIAARGSMAWCETSGTRRAAGTSG